MKILKILLILAVGAASVFAAVHITDEYVSEAAAREKTLAEAILNSQLEAEIKKAEEKAAQELGEALATTVVTTLPPETEPPVTETTPEETTVTTTAPPPETEFSETTEPVEEIITEFTRGGILPADRTGITVKTMFTLTPDEQNRLTRFLIDYYFLDGEVYVKNETRPELKEKKQLANRMEKSAIAALNLVLESINLSNVSSLMTADYGRLKDEITAIRDNFERDYSDSAKHGSEFESLYNDSLNYLNRLIEAIGRLDRTAKEYAQSSNPLLAAVLLANALEDVIIPEILAVLEQSFDLVETSQDIFLEGTQGTRLLSRDEVTEIIINPALVLDTGLA
ncbi:MAG: hypothetical protein IJZ72_03665 [Oscillospiraceae bacterium]|nr:hypothetical protein [Oscillospiraceae bacterium]